MTQAYQSRTDLPLPVNRTALPTPISRTRFREMMDVLGPFERAPHLAVAVSGGGDSMALCLMADRWARSRGGRVTALTVDHGLREGSAKEAQTVGIWLEGHGIEHVILAWTGVKPRTGIQAAARHARYELMTRWCRKAGVLHLALGHHRDDQAETCLMRARRNSGPDGLSGMSAVVETGPVRMLRPLLDVSSRDLKATLVDEGQAWIEDPSNQNPIYTRVRLRRELQGDGGDERAAATVHLIGQTRQYAARRMVVDGDVSETLARRCRVDPLGYAVLDGDFADGVPSDMGVRVLARVLSSVGGLEYAPGIDKTARLLDAVSNPGFKSQTLGNCRIVKRNEDYLVCREDRNPPQTIPVKPGERLNWDNRFQVTFGGNDGYPSDGFYLAALSQDGLRDIYRSDPSFDAAGHSADVLLMLPVVWLDGAVVSIPQLEYVAPGSVGQGVPDCQVCFRPKQSLSGSGFFVAPAPKPTISVGLRPVRSMSLLTGV